MPAPAPIGTPLPPANTVPALTVTLPLKVLNGLTRLNPPAPVFVKPPAPVRSVATVATAPGTTSTVVAP